MPKSEFKSLIAEMAPQCIESSENCPANFPVVIEDAIVSVTAYVLGLGKDNTQMSLDDLVRRVYGKAVVAAKHVRCYVMLMDKYGYVTTAKQAEQKNRDAKHAEQKNQDAKTESDIQTGIGRLRTVLSQYVAPAISMSACCWHRAFTGDRESKKFIVRLLTERAAVLLPQMMQVAQVPHGHRIVLDGECCDAKAAIFSCGHGARTALDSELEETLMNKLGEFDVAHVHHLENKALQRMVNETPDGAFLIKTVDTDMLLINAQRCVDTDYPPNVRIGMSMSKKTMIGGTPAQPGDLYYVDPHAIRAWADDLLRHTVSGFMGLVEVFHFAGSDFNHDGVPGVGNLALMRDFLTWAVRNPTGLASDFYKQRLQREELRLTGVTNASQRTLNLKRKCQHLQREAVHPIRRVHWVVHDYWSGVNQLSPLGQGYKAEHSDGKTQLCFAEYAGDLTGL